MRGARGAGGQIVGRLGAVPPLYWWLLALAGLFAAFALPFEPWIQPDSPGYITWSSYRQPLYPGFLWCWQNLLPAAWALYGAVISQLILGLGASFFCARRLQTLLNAPLWLGGVFLLLLLAPYFAFHYIGHAITSEGLAYPLFLMMAATFLTGILQRAGRTFFWSLFWTTLLVLTRGQFLFLYLVWALAVIGPSGLQKWRRVWLALGVIASFMTAQGIERTALYLKDGHFSTVPFTGSLALVMPLYLSGESDGIDEGMFSPEELQLFQAIHPGLKEAHLLGSDRPSDMRPLWHMEMVYNTIQFEHIFPAFERLDWDPYVANRVSIKLALHLSLYHLRPRVKLFTQMWVQSWGYAYTLLMGLLTLMVLGIVWRQRSAIPALPRALFWALAFDFANMGAILSVEMPLMRYMIYTFVLMGCFWIFLIWRALQTIDKN